MRAQNLHDPLHFFGRAGQHDGRREETLDGEGIALVYDTVAFLSQYVGRSDNLDQLIDNLGR